MTTKEKSILNTITKEVEEFHPLLDILLPQLPNVMNVEYTHGKDEMGADFVLSKQHDTFGHIEYVGVVAKIGKIHQDFTAIERQIDECSIPRFFLNGKGKINISEVWVIVTGNITHNAQKKSMQNSKHRRLYL